jgi:thioredoxin reductase (NADPH)
MGELAQLSDRPAFVDAVAKEPVVALVIPPPRLRELLVEDAELGERIMRALRCVRNSGVNRRPPDPSCRR